MKYTTRQQALLLLSDGTIFHGKSIGLSGVAFGEVCFNTGMTGYQEIFTDPSYFGQLMVATNAHIGNYGVNEKEVESDGIKISGLICKNFSFNHSRPDATESLESYFTNQNLICISDVDVRDPDEKSIMTYVAQFLQYSKDTSVSDEEMQVRHTHTLLNFLVYF